MNENESLTFHHHWLAFWQPLAIASLLVVLGPPAMFVWPSLGIGALVLAALVALGVYLFWRWHTFTFTDDQRLIRRRGVFQCYKDVIDLFGTMTPYQVPLLGELLNVGSIYLNILGPDIHIHHVANFGAFYERLIYSTGQQVQGPDSPLVQIVFQTPPGPP